METTLHRQLKAFYAGGPGCQEVTVGRFRVDALQGGELIEIQHASLWAIRGKVERLVQDHALTVVKPLAARRYLVKLDRPKGRVLSVRLSPRRGSLFDLFDELVYFVGQFPHPNLTLDVPLVDIEEWRYPGHGRRRWKRAADHQVQDRRLIEIVGRYRFRTARDLALSLPAPLPPCFHTGDMAGALGIERWRAQRIAYCLRHAGALREVGKRGNALVYEFTEAAAP
jgi:hypothetical protein